MARIGFDAKRFFRNSTGLGNYSRTLVENLRRFYPGDECWLYAPGKGMVEAARALLEGEVGAMEGVGGEGGAAGVGDGGAGVRGGMAGGAGDVGRGGVVVRRGGGAWWRTWGMGRDAGRDGVEVFHGLSHEIPAGMVGRGVRTVVTMHDVIYRTFPSMFSAVDRAIYDWKCRYACRHADRVVAISESTRADVERFFGVPRERMRVVYQAMGRRFYEGMSREEAGARLEGAGLPPRFLLYVGAVNERKNLLGAVRALERVGEGERVPLVVVGRGRGYQREVERWVAGHGMERWVRWMGGVGDDAVLQALYRRAEALVYPSFYEGFGLPVTEALLCETPVVTARVSSLPEAGGEFARYVERPGDVDGIRDLILKVLRDGEGERQRARAGREWAMERFDPGRLTRELHGVYEELLEGRVAGKGVRDE